eukprot:gene18716-24477_t
MEEFLTTYYSLADKIGVALIDWARPKGWPVSPTESWPLTDFRTAFTIALAYLAFVFIGRTIMPFLPAIPGLYPFKFLYNIAQILDFMDTIFIVLEKRWGQLSFLHVYHHTSIFLFYWLNTNVGYDGDKYGGNQH